MGRGYSYDLKVIAQDRCNRPFSLLCMVGRHYQQFTSLHEQYSPDVFAWTSTGFLLNGLIEFPGCCHKSETTNGNMFMLVCLSDLMHLGKSTDHRIAVRPDVF